jgi:hypothetical protein
MKKKRKKNDNIQVDKEQYEEIEYTDPITGEVKRQRVRVIYYKTLIPEEKTIFDELEE